jgi:hypothetical protein
MQISAGGFAISELKLQYSFSLLCAVTTAYILIIPCYFVTPICGFIDLPSPFVLSPRKGV